MRFLLIGLVAIVLGGCASSPLMNELWGAPAERAGGAKYMMAIDALASQAADHRQSYVILPGNEGVKRGDLQYLEYERYLARALELRGFEPVENREDADFAVLLLYGIGDPVISHRTYMWPIWGETGIRSSTTTGNARGSGNATRYGDTVSGSGNVSYSETTTYTPSYGITGYTPQTKTTVSYIRHAVMIAYDLPTYLATGEEVEIWRTVVQSEGPTDDLRRAMPVLIGAAAEHMATSTGKRLSVRMSENAPVVRAVRGEVTIDASQAINHAP